MRLPAVLLILWAAGGATDDPSEEPEVPWLEMPGTDEETEALVASARRLQDLPNQALQMEEVGGARLPPCGSFCPVLEGVHAAANYTLEIILVDPVLDPFTAALHTNARLKVVDDDMTAAQAREGQCGAGEPLVAGESEVALSWGQSMGSATTIVAADTLRADETLHFRMGGSYRICFSANGTFGLNQADVTDRMIDVNGIFDRSAGCMTPDCLSTRLQQCYMRRQEFNTADGRYGLQSSCVVDYSFPGAGRRGVPGRGTWTAEFLVTYDVNGAVTTMQAQPCAQTEPASFICRDGGACEAGDAYITPDTFGSAAREGPIKINIPTTRDDLFGDAFGSTTTYKARTVAACYCPDRNGCTSTVDFIQQVGILHFYLSKVCHAGSNIACTDDFTGVTGQYRFRIRVECPTDACMLNDQNRMKLVEKSLANDLPAWDSGNGCRTGLHGIIGGLEVLPTTNYVPIDGSPAGVLNEPNCDPGSPVGCRLTGGSRQDYKIFGGTYGFRFIFGTTNHEARGFHTSKEVDVCYCNSDCNTGSNWFKVGGMRVSSTRLVSAATSRSELPAQWSVEFVNQPGIIGLHRPYADGGVLGLQENGLLKLVPDKEKEVGDVKCAESGYNSQFSEGLSSDVAASTNYLGKLQTQTPPDLQKVVFNSNSFVNTITVTEAGTLAVCYCAVTVDSTCPTASNWKLITHLTVKGPQINQRWTFSTNVVFRFSYEGFGLTSGDTLRIISADGKCTDNNYNPNTAAFAYTALKVKCPVPCSDVTLTGGTEPGDLSTRVLSADSYNCDVNNQNCETNDITSITVLSATMTEIVFQKDHGLMTGDEITLGANIFCAAGDPVCTDEMLTALKGAFPFADSNTNSGTAPEMYLAAHKLTALTDPKKIQIHIGWPSPAPQFTIIYAGARPEIGYIGRGGLWTHHSRAQTQEEVMATAERANLRVCWRFGGNGAKYVEEVGKMTIRNPATMLGATISMSSAARRTAVPMILTFTTAGGVTGLRYQEAQDSLRLKIVFLRTDLLDILYADATGSEIPFTVTTEDDFNEASQAICGKLFLELWSADMERGFPMPKGCYYKGYPTGNRREVFLVFEGKNGLRQDTTYQMVFNGIVREDNVAPIPNEVVTNAQLLEIFPMDDVTSRPYEAIERGTVSLTTEPKSPTRGGGAEDPQFAAGGFKILGGYQDLLEIQAGDSLNVELMGFPTTAGRIQGSDIIRIFLWPLTQWQTTSSCTAQCVESGEISFLCGQITSCLGLPTVPGMALNILKITLPPCNTALDCQFDDLYGNRKVRIRLGGITIPSGGFFAQRLAAQVTDPGDSRPNYVLSSGCYIWKEPNVGITTAKVVSQLGGGNAKPFRGDAMNVLYARLTLSSTIKARDDTGTDASFTITLPQGYTCLDTSSTAEIAGTNTWMAEMTLPAFGSQVPQGRGTPTDGSATHGWTAIGNQCIYTPKHPDGIVYAGSSLVVKITVNNPSFALQRADANNVWTVQYANRGFHEFGNLRIRRVTQAYRFSSAADEMYQSNNAVLGIITDASCQPQVLSASTAKAVFQDLHFFFRTEQEVGPGGLIRLMAPPGFNFGQPCNATDLPAPYYATQANPVDATLPLPGIVSCTARGSEMRTAELRLERILVGGRVFGFKIRVENPQGFDPSQISGWTLFTADASDYIVDGTPQTIPFTKMDQNSWGIYSSASLEVLARISDLRPFVMTEQRAWVSVVISQHPAAFTGFIRFRAPEGYVWSFDDLEFVYQREENTPAALRALVPPGVTADFPSGVPLPRDGTNTLIFRPSTFEEFQIYGFAAQVEVPAMTPTASSNGFFLELGFNATDTTARPAAAYIEAPRVRSLKNARVDYATTIIGKENLVQFRLETITDIPPGGGIEVTVPEGFQIDANCELAQVRDPMAPPPPNLRCEAVLDSSLGLNGRLVLRLRAENGLAAAHHAFAVLSENPQTTLLNYPVSGTGNLACGTLICWVFESFQFLNNVTNPSSVRLDYSTAAQGFDITRQMLEARIPTLTEEQRLGTGRDDRPGEPNNLIFAIKLSQDASVDGQMMVRAPYGFTFEEECLSSVEVAESSTFGPKVRFPEAFSVWPSNVLISNCRGVGRHAHLTLTFQTGAVLMQNELYIFRIGIKSNPMVTPTFNRWIVQLAGEASEPIEGMTLWAFTQTSVDAITTARDRTLAGEVRTQNPLKFNLRPFNTIAQNGMIRAVAPAGFQWVHQPSKACTTEIEELPYTYLGVYYPGYVWPQDDLVCLVDADDSTKVSVRYRNPRPITAGLSYVVVLSVYNPSEILSYARTTWQISSFAANGGSLDSSHIEGFRLNEVMNEWYYSNADPLDATQEVRNGGARLPAFSLRLRSPTTLDTGDEIRIVAPSDFYLLDTQGNCRGFRWIDRTADVPVATFNPLPNSMVVCNSSSITMFIMEPSPVERDFLIEFGLDIYNPLRTPPLTDNFWQCTVVSATMDANGQRIIKASKAFQSWDIVPQLENLQVRLLGPNTAAETVSSIGVEFTPVTSAEDIAIQFNQPAEFDFGNARTDDDENQVIFLRDGPLVRIRLAIMRGVRTEIVLRNVVLGRSGGQTEVSITTWTGGLFQNGVWLPGAKQDERLAYRGGFRLPGKVEILYDKLENTFQRDPFTYPEQSLWNTQMGRPAYAEFHFHISVAAEVGDFLMISAAPYEPTRSVFTLVESPIGQSISSQTTVKRAIANEITTVFGGEIHVRLLEQLVPFRRYEVITSVILPTAQAAQEHGGAIQWFLETRDFGPLPKNTNDGNSREFPIVEEYVFAVSAARSPPLADIVVSLDVTPALAAPTSLKVTAPLGFNFTESCYGPGESMYISSCVPGQPTPSGRSTAELEVRGAPAVGLEGSARGILVRVTSPTQTPVAKEWFIEGIDLLSDRQLGWGQAVGIDVLPMQDTVAIYPGFTGVRSRIVWRFRTREIVQAGGYLDVRLPFGFAPECGPGSLEAISLPISGGCRVVNEATVHVFMNTTIVPNEYVFAFYVTPPATTPLFNELSIILRDPMGAVSDAAVQIPGSRILDKLRIGEGQLLWTSTKANRASTITISFDILESLPDLVVAPDQQIDEILITLPRGFIHRVEKTTDLQLMNENMPLREVDYLDYFQKDRLRISLELNRSSWVTLSSGSYGFRFEVMVPSPLPTFNIWFISLCSPNYPEGCTQITDPAVMATFAMPGFSLGDPANGLSLTGAAKTNGVPVICLLLLFVSSN